jgi:hypothetical protein
MDPSTIPRTVRRTLLSVSTVEKPVITPVIAQKPKRTARMAEDPQDSPCIDFW